jgi:hypothetical protein
MNGNEILIVGGIVALAFWLGAKNGKNKAPGIAPHEPGAIQSSAAAALTPVALNGLRRGYVTTQVNPVI